MEAKNERLWFKTQLKLCGLWFKLREYGRAQKILRELHKCAAMRSGPLLRELPRSAHPAFLHGRIRAWAGCDAFATDWTDAGSSRPVVWGHSSCCQGPNEQ